MVLILCRRSGGTQKKKLNEWGKKWIEVKILCDREVSRNDTGRIKKKMIAFVRVTRRPTCCLTSSQKLPAMCQVVLV